MEKNHVLLGKTFCLPRDSVCFCTVDIISLNRLYVHRLFDEIMCFIASILHDHNDCVRRYPSGGGAYHTNPEAAVSMPFNHEIFMISRDIEFWMTAKFLLP